MIFVDTNILVDLLDNGEWRSWSQERIESVGSDHDLVINAIVFAELAPRFDSHGSLRGWLAAFPIATLDIDDVVAFQSGSAFRAFRRRFQERDAILSDFLIGGHAQCAGAALMTRDSRLYRRYFPDLALITPETDND